MKHKNMWTKKGRYMNPSVTPEVFEQIKSMVEAEMVLEDMVPLVMRLTNTKTHYTAYRWITKAAVAVKNDLDLDETQQHYKLLGYKPKSLVSEVKESLENI